MGCAGRGSFRNAPLCEVLGRSGNETKLAQPTRWHETFGRLASPCGRAITARMQQEDSRLDVLVDGASYHCYRVWALEEGADGEPLAAYVVPGFGTVTVARLSGAVVRVEPLMKHLTAPLEKVAPIIAQTVQTRTN